jgi:hypothetical protein
LSAVVTYIHESQSLGASKSLGLADNGSNDLHSLRLTGGYLYDRYLGGRLSLATVRGSAEATYRAAAGVKTTSLSADAYVQPWFNTRVGLQGPKRRRLGDRLAGGRHVEDEAVEVVAGAGEAAPLVDEELRQRELRVPARHGGAPGLRRCWSGVALVCLPMHYYYSQRQLRSSPKTD